MSNIRKSQRTLKCCYPVFLPSASSVALLFYLALFGQAFVNVTGFLHKRPELLRMASGPHPVLSHWTVSAQVARELLQRSHQALVTLVYVIGFGAILLSNQLVTSLSVQLHAGCASSLTEVLNCHEVVSRCCCNACKFILHAVMLLPGTEAFHMEMHAVAQVVS